MRTLFLRGLLAASFLTLASSTGAAAVIAELETDGTGVNNAINIAQLIPGSTFTLPVPATVFNPPGYTTATIQGSGGLSDVDFYSFFSYGGKVYLDMDNSNPTFDPLLALFDSTGTLLAYGDDSDLDNGSTNTVDSFLGLFTLPSAGIYYIGVSEFANLPTTMLTGTETPLVRPDGKSGGFAVSGVAAGVSSYDFNAAQPGDAFYNLHVSVQAVPEPGSYVLIGAALTVLGCFTTRRTCREK